MDAVIIDTISQFIATVGFPIAAFAAMFWQANTTIKETTAAISENTQTLARVVTLLEKSEGC